MTAPAQATPRKNSIYRSWFKLRTATRSPLAIPQSLQRAGEPRDPVGQVGESSPPILEHDREAKVPIETIGLMSELTIAYKFKFVWAPFLDKYDAPIFSELLGRRRGWIVVSQIAVMLALAGVAFGDPADWLAYTVAFSLALGVAGATQDVTIDGWRITAVPVDKQSVMTAISEMGYRVGTLAAGAGALLLADRYGWRFAYLCMAALMMVGAISAFVAPEPDSDFTVQS